MWRFLGLMGALLVAASGCGKGSGGHSHAPAAAKQEFVDFVHAPAHQLALVTANGEASVVDPTGRLSAPMKFGTTELTALGNGDITVVSGGNDLRAVDRSGKLLWSTTVQAAELSMGTSAFGVASDKGAELLSVTTGAALYTDPHPAKRVFYRANEGFVFASDDEVWFIDEKTPRERWRQHVDRVADAAFIHADVSPTFLITRLDHSYSELAYADGKLSSGQCTGILDEDTHKASFCAGRPPASSNKEAVSLVARSADLVTYYATIGVSGTDRLSSFDQVGRKRWDSAWPIKTAEIERPAMFAPKAGLVGFVLTPGEGDRTFLVFDDATGAAQFQRTLSAKEWIAGITDSCWIIVREKDVACLDARSGNDHWNVRTAGTDAGAWPLAGGGALVADSNPLTLSRIDDTGKRVWQTELPDTELQHGKYGDWRLMTGDERWRLSDVLGIRTGVSSTVIDLASGKLETMHR